MADTKWSDFPAASSVADADITAVVQGGTNKKSAMSVIKAYLLAAFNSIYVPLTRTLTIGGSAQTLASDRSWTSTTILDGVGSPAQGQILYRGSANWVLLTPGTDGNQLTTHGAGANPTWDSGTVVTPAALTKTNDTNVTLTLGGTPTTALLQATSLTLGWTGTLAAARGGTGVGSLGNISKVDDTNVTLTLGGTPTGAVITSTSLTLGWTGTLAAGRGGTGVSSLGNITKTDDTNVTLALGGTPTGAVINATSFTLGWTGTLGVSRGGFGKAMTDPNADRLVMWDDTDNDFEYITLGTGLTYTHGTHTLAASGGGSGTTSQVTGSNFTTSGGALDDITGLTFAAAINKVYEVDVLLKIQTTGTSGIKFAIAYSGGGGATGQFTCIASGAVNGSAQTYEVNVLGTSTGTAQCTSANNDYTVAIKSIVSIGAATGNITVKMQRIGASTATCYIGSRMTVTLLA